MIKLFSCDAIVSRVSIHGAAAAHSTSKAFRVLMSRHRGEAFPLKQTLRVRP